MEHRWTKRFYCDECGAVCIEIRLSRTLNVFGGESYALIHSICGDLWVALNEERYWKIIELLSKNDFRPIFDMNKEYVPFYCEKCNKCYCRKHWNHWIEWDEDGYYDAEMGFCPKRHQRMLYD